MRRTFSFAILLLCTFGSQAGEVTQARLASGSRDLGLLLSAARTTCGYSDEQLLGVNQLAGKIIGGDEERQKAFDEGAKEGLSDYQKAVRLGRLNLQKASVCPGVAEGMKRLNQLNHSI